MGQVMIKYQIMPDSAEMDMEAFEASVKGALGNADVRNTVVVPIAFGLKSLEMVLVMGDGEGAEELEASINDVKGVQSVKVLAMDLL